MDTILNLPQSGAGADGYLIALRHEEVEAAARHGHLHVGPHEAQVGAVTCRYRQLSG